MIVLPFLLYAAAGANHALSLTLATRKQAFTGPRINQRKARLARLARRQAHANGHRKAFS